MGGALGLRAATGEPFGGGLSGAAEEQPATVGVGPACTVGGVLRCPRVTRTANGRGVHPPGSGTRLESSSTDRPHLEWCMRVKTPAGDYPKARIWCNRVTNVNKAEPAPDRPLRIGAVEDQPAG